MIRVFADTSALFAAMLSPRGAMSELIRIGIRGELQIVVSADVLTELERNLRNKAPASLPLIENLVDDYLFELAPPLSKEEVHQAEAYVVAKDAYIVAAAIKARVDYLATFDRKHLIDPPEVALRSGLVINTPGEILTILRKAS
jgi:predicted nucleic acid-binding protein